MTDHEVPVKPLLPREDEQSGAFGGQKTVAEAGIPFFA